MATQTAKESDDDDDAETINQVLRILSRAQALEREMDADPDGAAPSILQWWRLMRRRREP